jgi:DinB superfamily
MSTDSLANAGQPITRFEPPAAERRRSAALADRLERGALALITLAEEMTDVEWRTRIPGDGRTIGVVLHHVASMYPIETQFVQLLAEGRPVAGVTWNDIHALNAKHASENDGATKEAALALLRANSATAAAAVRALTDEQLDRAAPVSLNADAPLTCQFFVEDHPLRHSYHHLAKIRSTLGR